MGRKLVIVFALMLAACSPAADESSDTTQSPAPAATEAPVTTTSTAPEVSTNEEAVLGGVSSSETALGTVLVDETGRTLYIFTVDDGDVSACYDDCEANWPVVAAGADAGDLEVITGSTTRNDDSEQLTINGRPVYLFAVDSGPGDVNGQGVFDVWYVLDADGEPVDGAVSSADTSLGTGLVDQTGRTLYFFTVDDGDVSACYDDCEANWPVVPAGAVIGEDLDLLRGFTTRTDGSEQRSALEISPSIACSSNLAQEVRRTHVRIVGPCSRRSQPSHPCRSPTDRHEPLRPSVDPSSAPRAPSGPGEP